MYHQVQEARTPTCGEIGVVRVFRNMQTTHITCSERDEVLNYLKTNKQTLDLCHVMGTKI
jgi:hypothetical protein